MGACCSAPREREPHLTDINSETGSRTDHKQTAKEAKAAADREKQKRHDETQRQLADRSVVEGLGAAYRVKKLLGKGAAGNTWLGLNAMTGGEPVAIKLIKLPLPNKYVQAIFREIKLQSELGEGHDNIITPEEVILSSNYLGLVMEYAPGGSLTQYVSQKYKECNGVGLLVDEDIGRYLFRQILNAVEHCHQHNVVHRDLKLDNTLLSDHDPPMIKLCDFGFARGWGEKSQFITVIGTPDYMSPQLTGAKTSHVQYDGTKSDVWAMGVLLCVILTGKFPFEGDSISTMGITDPMKRLFVQQNKVIWRENKTLTSQLKFLSPEAISLLDGMFELDEKKRFDISTIRQHPWYLTPMRSDLQAATERMEREHAELEIKIAAGAYKSKARDVAIGQLVKLAGSDAFKKRAAEPISEDSTFKIFSRLSLRTIKDSYPVFDKSQLNKAMKTYDKEKCLEE